MAWCLLNEAQGPHNLLTFLNQWCQSPNSHSESILLIIKGKEKRNGISPESSRDEPGLMIIPLEDTTSETYTVAKLLSEVGSIVVPLHVGSWNLVWMYEVTEHYTMKTYGGADVWTHVFLTLALYGDEWSLSRPGRFTPGTHWIGGWVGPRASLNDMETW
jgi:hypothetical protein